MNGLTAAAAASFAQRVRAQETPGGDGVDYAMMARGAGYRDAFAVRTLEELKHPER
jgi:hypothetical protein